METYYSLGRSVVIIALLAQCIMLALQASALRRHGHRFLWLLCIGSICGFIYALLTGVPYFLPLSVPSTLFFLKVAVFFGGLGTVLGIWGTALLFRSYSELSEVAALPSGGGDYPTR